MPDQNYNNYYQQQPQQPNPYDPGMPSGGAMVNERTHIEEIAEAIIDEKWEEMTKNFNKINEWKEKTDGTISRMQQQMEDLAGSFDKLHKAIIGKIGEYDQNILNVGTEIKAMERVFQKILPTFTDNVNELGRITKQIAPIVGAVNPEPPKKKI